MVMISNPLYRNIAQPYQQNTQPLYGSYFGTAPVAQGLGFQLGMPTTVGGMLTMTGLPTPTQPPASAPVLTTPTVAPVAPTTNASSVAVSNVPPRRDAVAMAVPRPAVPLSEKLMRVGGAIVGASEKGGLAAFQAGTDEYGNIMDKQRELDLLYGRDVNDRMAASAAAQQEALAENMEAIGMYQMSLSDFAKAKEHLKAGGITGLFDNTLGRVWDDIMGNPEAGGRLLLDKLKVDDALLRIAQTKGAISNKEMDLFLSPAPKGYQDEKVWLDWIEGKERAAMTVLYRLQNNIVVGSGQRPTPQSFQQFSQMYGVGTQNTAPAAGQTQNYTVGGQTVPVKNITPTP